MERYTIDALRAMLCRELDETVMRGIKTHQDLDIVKDTTEALKNLDEIEMSMLGSQGMGEYSQRSRAGNYARGNSYNYDGNSYLRDNMGDDGGNSRIYGPSMMERKYSRTGSKEEVLQELHQIIENATDEKVKNTVLECVAKMERLM